MQDLTPYAAMMITNIMFAKNHINVELDPQPFYGYAKSGTIASNYKQFKAAGGKGHGIKVMFDGESFNKWLTQEIDNRKNGRSGRSKVNYSELATQYVNETSTTS